MVSSFVELESSRVVACELLNTISLTNLKYSKLNLFNYAMNNLLQSHDLKSSYIPREPRHKIVTGGSQLMPISIFHTFNRSNSS